MNVNLRTLSMDELTGLLDGVIYEIKHRKYQEGFDAAKAKGWVAEEDRKSIPELSSQQVRDSIVEQAKRDVAEIIDQMNDGQSVELGNATFRYHTTIPEFIVNREKRTVVTLVKGARYGRLFERGIAKADPSECFNSHIGKAISLRRALGLEVPAEYLNAPQPTEVRVGDILEWLQPNHTYKVTGIKGEEYRFERLHNGWDSGYLDYANTQIADKIIDDSRE